MLFTGLGIRDWGFGKAGAAPWPAPCVGPGMTAEFFESPIPNPESRGERQFALWIARLSTAIAASWIDSDRRSEEHTSELQSLMRISYAVFCLQKKNKKNIHNKLT